METGKQFLKTNNKKREKNQKKFPNFEVFDYQEESKNSKN